MLNCKGAPKKPPQQLEWKLVSGAPVSPLLGTPVRFASPLAHLPSSSVLSPRVCTVEAPLLYPQNTGRTEAWKVLSPQGDPWDSVARVLPNGSLLLPAVGIQDEGTFRCRATSRSGKETKSNYRVRVYRKGSQDLFTTHLSSKEKPSTPAFDSLALAWENLTSAAPFPHPWCENLQSCGL